MKPAAKMNAICGSSTRGLFIRDSGAFGLKLLLDARSYQSAMQQLGQSNRIETWNGMSACV
jgi:hypothetical protein